MDVLTSVLDGPRAQGAFLLRSILDPPWSCRVEDRAPLTVVAIVRGSAWVRPSTGTPYSLASGDVAVIRGPDPYIVSDAVDTAPEIVIHPGQRCTTLDGRDLHDTMALGVRTWGNSPTGSTVMLTGTYHLESELSGRLLAALPVHVHVASGSIVAPVVSLLAAEMAQELPGQQAVLDRLLDLVLITALRSWFNRAAGEAPAWYRAQSDPVVGSALRLMQDQPANTWTVASLASATGCSRAVLARRFHELLGQPPMTYLTDWRLSIAADLLREPNTTIAAVAERVGYATPFALSAAFKRVRGVSPIEHRRANRSPRGA